MKQEKEILDMLQKPLLIEGDSGAGKTEFSKSIKEIYENENIKVYEINPWDHFMNESLQSDPDWLPIDEDQIERILLEIPDSHKEKAREILEIK